MTASIIPTFSIETVTAMTEDITIPKTGMSRIFRNIDIKNEPIDKIMLTFVFPIKFKKYPAVVLTNKKGIPRENILTRTTASA